MTDIVTNIQDVWQTIRDAAMQAGRDPHTVRLIAVTKYVEVAWIRQAITAGITICGENRFQEAQAKMESIGDQLGVTWHFIGRLQRRKLQSLVGRFALIHSVESLEQIEALHHHATEQHFHQPVLLQVNIGNESTKGGFSVSGLLKAIPGISKCRHVKVHGLMAIPPWAEDPEAMRPHFRKLKTLAEEVETLHAPGVAMKELSMGMSNDYPIAIQEGATMVRIGSALFGPRPTTFSNAFIE